MVQRKQSGEEILITLIELLTFYLGELSSLDVESDSEYASGEQAAYTECLEIIQSWEKAKEHGLDWEIEARYPL